MWSCCTRLADKDAPVGSQVARLPRLADKLAAGESSKHELNISLVATEIFLPQQSSAEQLLRENVAVQLIPIYLSILLREKSVFILLYKLQAKLVQLIHLEIHERFLFQVQTL